MVVAVVVGEGGLVVVGTQYDEMSSFQWIGVGLYGVLELCIE